MCTTRRSALEDRMPRTSTGSAGVTKIGHLDGRSVEIGRRPKHGRAARVRLRPRARRLVEPVGLAVALEPEAQFAEVLAVIDVRPEEPLDLAPLADRREERAVAEDRRRPERVPPARLVERSRDVGLRPPSAQPHRDHRGGGDRAVARSRDRDERDRLTAPVVARIDEDAVRRAVVRPDAAATLRRAD